MGRERSSDGTHTRPFCKITIKRRCTVSLVRQHLETSFSSRGSYYLNSEFVKRHRFKRLVAWVSQLHVLVNVPYSNGRKEK